jgi:hypothetical protein
MCASACSPFFLPQLRVNECKGTFHRALASNRLDRMTRSFRRPVAPIPFGEKCLSIKFAVKLTACLALAGGLSFISQAQQTTSPGSDSSAQTQSHNSTSQDSSATDSNAQSSNTPASNSPAPNSQSSASQTQTAPPQNSNQQTPAQQSQPQAQSQQSSDKNKDNPDTGGKVAGTSNDRLFYALPNFLTVQNQKLPPLSVKDKFKVVALGNFDPIQYPWWGIVAAVAQAENSEPQFRQGWLSYAKRYGTTAGDSSVENFMVGAVFPSILHQDPRFYYSQNGGIPRRILYAASRIFVTHSDSGHAQFNFSEIFGAATAAAISDYTYHPRSAIVNGKFVPSDRTLSNTAIVFGTQIGLDSITFGIKEFWPDIHRHMARKRQAKQAASPPSQ